MIQVSHYDNVQILLYMCSMAKSLLFFLAINVVPPRRGVVESVGEMAKTPTCRPHVAYTANLSPNERLHVAYMSTTRLFFE